MQSKLHTYDGPQLTVRFDSKRCIHAAACVHGLPAVFDPKGKPWVQPEAAAAQAVAEVVQRCPSGALHFTPEADGPAPEAVPAQNTIQVVPDGPLYLRGNLRLEAADGTVLLEDTRMALCRCGLSKNKPLCDLSHTDRFSDDGTLGQGGVKVLAEEEMPPVLTVVAAADGPLLLRGPFEVCGAEDTCRSGHKGALCRCGGSSNKPFCDGSHRSNGFRSSEG